jgi:hypothetical protein
MGDIEPYESDRTKKKQERKFILASTFQEISVTSCS